MSPSQIMNRRLSKPTQPSDFNIVNWRKYECYNHTRLSGLCYDEVINQFNLPSKSKEVITHCNNILYYQPLSLTQLKTAPELINNEEFRSIFYSYLSAVDEIECKPNRYELLTELTSQLVTSIREFYCLHPELLAISYAELQATLDYITEVSKYRLNTSLLIPRCTSLLITLYRGLTLGNQ